MALRYQFLVVLKGVRSCDSVSVTTTPQQYPLEKTQAKAGDTPKELGIDVTDTESTSCPIVDIPCPKTPGAAEH